MRRIGPFWQRKPAPGRVILLPERPAGPGVRREPGRRRGTPAAVAALFATMAVVLSGCGSLSSYAATVNGEQITQADLRRELNAILDNKKYLDQVDQRFSSSSGGQEKVNGQGKGTFNTVFVAAVLDRRIGFVLIHQEVARRKLSVSADLRRKTRADVVKNFDTNYGKGVFNAFPADYRDELVRIFAEQTVLQRALGSGGVDAKDIQKFYEANRSAFEQTCVRHILVATKEKADEVKAKLDAGEDFAALARAESTDNAASGGSAQQGGDLGCVGAGALVPEFEQAMNALQPGQTSAPVQTQFGFHIIQVSERKSLSLAEATPQIRQNLQSQAPDPLQVYVTKALTKADIKVNPRYGRFVKSPSPGVRAPKLLLPSTSVPAEQVPGGQPLPQGSSDAGSQGQPDPGSQVQPGQ